MLRRYKELFNLYCSLFIRFTGGKDYSPSTGASSSRVTRVSISPDFSSVFVFTKKYFMKTFGAAALGAPCLLS